MSVSDDFPNSFSLTYVPMAFLLDVMLVMPFSLSTLLLL